MKPGMVSRIREQKPTYFLFDQLLVIWLRFTHREVCTKVLSWNGGTYDQVLLLLLERVQATFALCHNKDTVSNTIIEHINQRLTQSVLIERTHRIEHLEDVETVVFIGWIHELVLKVRVNEFSQLINYVDGIQARMLLQNALVLIREAQK